MKKIISLFLVLALLLSFSLSFTVRADGENMLTNSGFSGGTSGWTGWATDESKAKRGVVYGEGSNETAVYYLENTAEIPHAAFQFPKVEVGKKYYVAADVKTENVDGGSGAALGFTGYNANGDWFCETLSSGLYGTNDWTRLEFEFEVPEGVASCTIGFRLWFATGKAWFDNIYFSEASSIVREDESGVRTLTLSPTANKFAIDSYGCEWDPKLYLNANTRRGVGDDDLALIKERMEKLNIQRVRMMILPEWFELKNDNRDPFTANPNGFDFDNDEMKSVFAYLDVCEQLGVKVTLTWWGAQRYVGDGWLAFDAVSDWVSAPNDLDEMAENIVYLIDYAINTKGYTCITDLILQNEPSYSFIKKPGAADIDYYIEYYKTVYNRLKDAGLGDKITMVGGDDAENISWFKKAYDGLKDICGKFNSHCYKGFASDYNIEKTVQNYTSQRTQYATEKPFYMGEFGDGSTVGAYTATSVDTYERGLFLPVSVVNGLKAGSTGSLYWPLHDVYYYDGDPNDGSNGGLMKMGLFAYKTDGNWRVRPTYHAWGLICNYLLPGSQVYDITCDYNKLDTVAAQTPDGDWTILAVNRSNKTQTATLTTDRIATPLNYYLYSHDTVTENDEIIGASHVVYAKNGTFSFDIPAESFVVLSNIGMDKSATLGGEPSAWAKEEILKALEADLVPEHVNCNYTTDITRSDFCDLIIKMIEKKSSKDIADVIAGYADAKADVSFPDTDSANVIAAAKLGIVNGRASGAFDPTANITRQEAAKMLALAAKVLGADITASEVAFADADDIYAWAKEFIYYVNTIGVMNGTSTTTPPNFSPLRTYTREQSILTVYRLFNAL